MATRGFISWEDGAYIFDTCGAVTFAVVVILFVAGGGIGVVARPVGFVYFRPFYCGAFFLSLYTVYCL